MLNNYLKIAVRTLLRFKGFAIINLFGLSLGLTAGILIMMFVADELSLRPISYEARSSCIVYSHNSLPVNRVPAFVAWKVTVGPSATSFAATFPK